MEDKAAQVTIYGAEWCPPCHMAKNYFKSQNISFDYINVDQDQVAGREIALKTGWTAIPIIKIGEEYILGFERTKIDQALRASHLMK